MSDTPPSNLSSAALGMLRWIGMVAFVAVVLVAGLTVWIKLPHLSKDTQEKLRLLNEATREVARLKTEVAKLGESEEYGWKLWNWPGTYFKNSAFKALQRELREWEDKRAAFREDWLISVVETARTHWRLILWVLIVVFVLPPFWRFLGYYVFMPALGRWVRPSRLLPAELPGEAVFSLTGKPLAVLLNQNESIWVRSTYTTARSSVDTTWRFFWRVRSPLISSAAHLWFALEVTNEDRIVSGSLELNSNDADCYVAEIRLAGHPGFVVRPVQLLAVSSGIEVQTLWRFGLHEILQGQFRYILLKGSGRFWMRAFGGAASGADAMKPTAIEHPLLIGFDARAAVGVTRTQDFLAYVCGKAELCDKEIGHGYLHIRQQTRAQRDGSRANPLEYVLQAIGKVLGL